MDVWSFSEEEGGGHFRSQKGGWGDKVRFEKLRKFSPNCFDSKLTWLTHLLSFASLFLSHCPTKSGKRGSKRLVWQCGEIALYNQVLNWKNAAFSQIYQADLAFWLFIFTLNRAKTWFNSIFNSKLNNKYSFNKLFIQIGNKITAWQNSEKQVKGVRSVLFYSFNNSFNSTAKIFIQQKIWLFIQ